MEEIMNFFMAYWKHLLVVMLVLALTAAVVLQSPDEPAPLAAGETPAPTQTSWRLPFFRPSPTLTATASPTVTLTLTPTSTPTRVPTRTRTPTPTPVPLPQVNVLIRTCDTGFDLVNRLGEVTNAYVTVQNLGKLDATDVQVELSGTDEGQVHADKSFRFKHLPAGHEISLRLTIDTQTGVDTAIMVRVASSEGVDQTAARSSCIRRTPDREIIRSMGELFVVRALPAPTSP